MVLVDRNPENLRNGRRSRPSSPNGAAHGLHTPEDSSDDDNSTKKNQNGTKPSSKGKVEFEEKIRVGKDYQAICPELVPITDRRPDTLNDRALLVWSPTKDIPESKLEEYISVAKEKYGYNGEQALGMLFWHKHDLERAVLDLANFTPFPDEWTVEDKVLFEQAFQFHGKSFHRIRQMLPDKSIASLVKYYYSWKKTRSRTSVMDRQEKKKNDGGSSENGSENGSNDESDNEDKKWPIHRGIRRSSHSPTNRANSTHSSINTNNNKNGSIQSNFSQNQNISNDNGTTYKTPTLNQQTASASMNKQGNQNSSSTSTRNLNNNSGTDVKTDENTIKDAGYSSSSSSTSGQQMPHTSSASLNCSNCGVLCNELKNSIAGNFCYSCHHHWRRTGVLRPTTGPNYLGARTGKRSHPKTGQLYFYHGYHDGASNKHKRKPPKGMYINHDDVVKLATQSKMIQNSISNQNSASNFPNSSGSNFSLLTSSQQTINNSFPQMICNENHPDDLLASMDREIVSLWSQIQTNKQKISSSKRDNASFVDDRTDNINLNSRNNSRWSNEETMLAVKCVQKYGKNFQEIADTLGTKTEAQVRQFYSNSRRRHSLDSIVKEQEAAHSKKSSTQLAGDEKSTITDPNPSTNSFLDPKFVIDSKSKANKRSDNIIMEIDLDDDAPVQNGNNEQIGNIDEIIGVNASSNNNKNIDEDDDVQMENQQSEKTLPKKQLGAQQQAKEVEEEATVIDDDDEDMEVAKVDAAISNGKNETANLLGMTEERPAISIIPIPKDSSKTKSSSSDETGGKTNANKPEVELIENVEISLKSSQAISN